MPCEKTSLAAEGGFYQYPWHIEYVLLLQFHGGRVDQMCQIQTKQHLEDNKK